MKRLSILQLLICLFLAGNVIWAQVTQIISYQGVLTDNDGKALRNQNFQITFRIQNQGGSNLWSEIHPNVGTDNNGVFNVILGTIDPTSNPLDLPFNDSYCITPEFYPDLWKH